MRLFNRLFGLLLGLALAGAGGIAVVEVILAAIGDHFVLFPADHWLNALRSTQWHSVPATVGSAVAAGVGLVLLIAEIRPWRPRRIRLSVPGAGGAETQAGGGGRGSEAPGLDEPDLDDPGPYDMDWWLLRRSVETHVRRTTLAATPADRARIRVSARRRRWRARVRVNAPAEARADVEEAVRASLERLGAPPGGLRVKVRRLRFRKHLRVA